MTSPEPFHHLPVMVGEITALFEHVPPGVVLDATLGGGGHANALLDAWPHLSVLGLDRDEAAIGAARERLAVHGERFHAYHCRFDDLEAAMEAFSLDSLSGALFDLGVSSPQLDRAERGFSYRKDAPLDMRMDTSQTWTAADVVNGYPAEALARVLHTYGDERFARRIATAIVSARPIETTTRLAEVVVGAIPAPARRTGGHPAKRTFQAIRIEVNGELDALPDALDRAMNRTTPGGRVAVLSYHSGEDRIVKDRMRLAQTGGCECPADLVRKVPRTPDDTEQSTNRRSVSARLRVVERITDTPTRGQDH
jgi:16S rRNA (cytosine1402-N4)-methyltransferase